MQIAVLEGYKATPKSRRRRKSGGGRGHSTFGAAARACAHEGSKPGTKSFGACMRRRLSK